MFQPIVSIVIPCFNKKLYVAAAIQSALFESELAEVIVIDDGSTDGSLEEVRRFDGQIIWETGSNRGGSAARNRGLALARGKYIQFLDADDLLPKGKLAVQLAVLKRTGSSAMAFCPWCFFHDDGRIDPPDPRRYWRDFGSGFDLLLEMWTYGGFSPSHAWLTPRALIDAAGPWDESLTADDDGEFFARVLIQASQIHFTSCTKVLYRDPQDGSVSRSRTSSSNQSFMASYLTVSRRVLLVDSGLRGRRACLSRVRDLAYQLRDYKPFVANASAEERRLWLWDLSPRLPPIPSLLIGILGIQKGLRLYRLAEQLLRLLKIRP